MRSVISCPRLALLVVCRLIGSRLTLGRALAAWLGGLLVGRFARRGLPLLPRLLLITRLAGLTFLAGLIRRRRFGTRLTLASLTVLAIGLARLAGNLLWLVAGPGLALLARLRFTGLPVGRSLLTLLVSRFARTRLARTFGASVLGVPRLAGLTRLCIGRLLGTLGIARLAGLTGLGALRLAFT